MGIGVREISNCLRPSRHRAQLYDWSTGGLQGSVTILYCAWSFVSQTCQKTKRNAGFFFNFVFYTLLHLWWRKITKIWLQSSKKEVKMEVWGGSGGSWGAPGGIWAPKWPKGEKSSKKWVRGPPPRGPVGSQNLIKMWSGDILCRFLAVVFRVLIFHRF